MTGSDYDDDDEASPEAVIRGYEDLLARSSRMLAWARVEDWNSLISEETYYVSEVNRLAELDERVTLNEDQQRAKAELLERILEQSLEVKRYLGEQRDMLGQKIRDTQQRREVIDRYLDWGVRNLEDGQ